MPDVFLPCLNKEDDDVMSGIRSKLSRKKVELDVPALLGKVDINWFSVDISICLQNRFCASSIHN